MLGITAKPAASSLSSGVLLVVTGFWQLRRKVFVKPFACKTLETYFLSSAFELSEDDRKSALLSKVLATDFFMANRVVRIESEVFVGVGGFTIGFCL